MRTLLKRLLTGLFAAVAWFIGPRLRRRLLRLIRDGFDVPGFDAEVAEIATPGGPVRFYCLGDLPRWRAETLLTKEPETIEWLDSMGPDAVLFDIGANVGVYTIYAASVRKIRVLAFEPLAANYYLLNRNIQENRLAGRAMAYCLALSDRNMIGSFHVHDGEFGSALSSFGDAVDFKGDVFTAAFEQGMVGMSLDSFIATYDPPFPTHIKIDVDGIEDRIVAGAPKTLADPRLKSVSIELDAGRPAYTDAVIENIEAAGLAFAGKRRSPQLDGTPYASIYNYHFHRP